MSNLELKDIKTLIAKNRGENGALNCALIAAASIWGLKAGELSLVQVGDVLDSRGVLKKQWVLRSGIAFNGYTRDIYTEHESLVKYLNAYIDFRVQTKIGLSNIGEYRGLDSESRLFIDPVTNKAFKFTRRRSGIDTDDEHDASQVVIEQPTGINAYFKKLFENASMGSKTYKEFRRSLAIQMYREGSRKTGVIKEIMKYLGIRSYSAIRKLVDSDARLLHDMVKGIHTKI